MQWDDMMLPVLYSINLFDIVNLVLIDLNYEAGTELYLVTPAQCCG